jgi:predicted nucleic acid-binding protein
MGPSPVTLDDALRGVSSIAIDTAIFIYFVEQHPARLSVVREALRRVDSGAIYGRSSTITLTEVLTLPLRAGNRAIESDYRRLLRGSRNFSLVAIDATVAERAADLRARYNLKTPDALHLACAIESACDAFLTNDSDLRRVTDIPVLILDELTL